MRNPHSNSNSNIELGSRSSSSQPSRPYPGLNLPSGSRNANYLPQFDEDASPENPQLPLPEYQSSQYTFWYKISRKKAVNIPILLVLLLSLIDMIPICGGIFYFFKNLGPNSEMRFDMTNLLPYLSADLNADPIMEIQTMEKGSTCPSDFQILNLGTWPGTVAGCICEDGQLWPKPCESVNSPTCKKDLPRSSPIEIYEWNDSIWCIKRAKLGTDYIRKAVCPSGYKECYPGGCFKGDCPVTKVKIDSMKGRNKLNNDQEKYLIVTKAQGELPLINIQMTFGNIPCFIQDLFAQTIKNSTYGLSAIRNQNCDKYGLDNHFSSILGFQIAELTYMQNSFPDAVMRLPYFETYAQKTISVLSSKVRMKTAKHDYCQDINDEPINNFIEGHVLPDVFIFMGFICLLLPRICFTCEILHHRTNSRSNEFFDKLSDLIKQLYQINFWTSIIVIIILVCFKSMNSALLAAKGYFEGYETLGCFSGGQGSMVIGDYLANLRKIESSFWIYWLLLVSSLLSGLMSSWLYIVKNKLPQYNLAS